MFLETIKFALEKRKKFKNWLYEQTLIILKIPLTWISIAYTSVSLIAINIKSSETILIPWLRFTNSQSGNADFHECLLFLFFRQFGKIQNSRKHIVSSSQIVQKLSLNSNFYAIKSGRIWYLDEWFIVEISCSVKEGKIPM